MSTHKFDEAVNSSRQTSAKWKNIWQTVKRKRKMPVCVPELSNLSRLDVPLALHNVSFISLCFPCATRANYNKLQWTNRRGAVCIMKRFFMYANGDGRTIRHKIDSYTKGTRRVKKYVPCLLTTTNTCKTSTFFFFRWKYIKIILHIVNNNELSMYNLNTSDFKSVICWITWWLLFLIANVSEQSWS